MNKDITKDAYFYMRISATQKQILKDMALRKNMTMTQYMWHLITKDKENINVNID